MFLPTVVVDIYRRIAGSFHRRYTIPPGMSLALVEIALIVPQLILQVSSGPEKGLIQQLGSYATNQSFNKGM